MKRIFLLLLAGASFAFAQPFTYAPYRSTGNYEAGETVGWKLTPSAGAGHFKYQIRRNNLDVLKSGELDFTPGSPVTIEIKATEPEMIYVQIDPDPAPAKPDPKSRIALGAAVSPRKLPLSTPRPADFDAFWNGKLQELSKVPIHPVLTPVETGIKDVETSTVVLDSLGSHVQGYLAKPAREGKFPALVIYQYAGVYALKTQTVTSRAAEGWLAFDVDSHDMPPSEATAPADYAKLGNSDREKSYFLNMYLRDARAIDYIMSRPDWDGHTIVITGTSMGGQQSLVTAGLRADQITAVVVNEPSGADLNGPLHGRRSGYPNWPTGDPKTAETALYFDPINFASRIKAPALVAIGFVDTTSPPAGLWTVLNQIPVPNEAIPMIESDHNNRTPEKQGAWEARSREVLDLLLKGGQVHPRPEAKPADQPAARTDANSMVAHQQLLEKRTKGKIDVYFEGDSITRRWGATDYPEFLANWKQNFFGWNAADFGWGADRLENILWRLENGELDGVNPKAIVFLGGTNNLGSSSAEDITAGIQAILRVMKVKAPEATIVLTAIFPRNDNMAFLPVIGQVNRKLAAMADGKSVRFLDVNGKLADGDGKLFPDMMNKDQLHPALKGYQVWADGLKPILTEVLGAPKSEDQAPPATGDPKVR